MNILVMKLAAHESVAAWCLREDLVMLLLAVGMTFIGAAGYLVLRVPPRV